MLQSVRITSRLASLGTLALVSLGISITGPGAVGQAVPVDLAALASQIDSTVTWFFKDGFQLREGHRQETQAVRDANEALKDLDRSSVLDEALARASATQRLVLVYVPRILAASAGRQMYRPAVPDLYMRATAFSDPECVAVMNERYVCVRLVADDKVGPRLGLAAPDQVEPALVFLKPDGTIVHRVDRIRTFNTGWFVNLLEQVAGRGVLASAPGNVDDPREWIELARAHRRAGQDDAAQAGLTRARELLGEATPDGPRLTAELEIEWGRLHLRDRRFTSARDSLERCLQACAKIRVRDRQSGASAGPTPAAAAHYHLALLDWFTGDDEGSRRNFLLAIQEDPTSVFSARAAVNLADGPDLTPLGPLAHGFEDPFRPPLGNGAFTDSAVAKTPADADDLTKDAVRFLLQMQRSHGGFTDSRYAYWGSPRITPNVWVATTAVALTALATWRHIDPVAIDAAIARGEAFLLDERRMARGQNEEIYADAYTLLYLARCLVETSSDERQAMLRQRMAATVRQLQRTQSTNGAASGHWAHEYPNPFATAAVINCLEKVRALGVPVPPKVFESAGVGLESTRDEQTGAFAYGAGRNRGSSPKDSMARSPICEAAILWSGHPNGSKERVAAAVTNFFTYLPRFERIRKCDFHTDGELGGFFFWHGVYHTSEALATLPVAQREEARARLLEHVTAISELDGSFVDSHEIGKSYGTAMALLTLANLLDLKRP